MGFNPNWSLDPEIKTKIRAIFSDGATVEVGSNFIRLSRMYDYVKFAFPELSALAELLGTKNINFGDRWHSDGCETCDYGSSYTVEFEINPPTY